LAFPIALRRLALVAGIALAAALYLADLTGMGLYGPDEPRYAAIGRAMARYGDWVTPRLWGQPWFEKPVLLYWMTASAFRLGLGPDLAPRLPVALLSLAFLAFFWWRLRAEWGSRVALCSTAMLATSVGWLAYSHIAVTDLPLAVFFCAAVLLSIPWIARQQRTGLTAAAASLGLAALAKGLVPLVLFLPIFAFGWRRLGDWLRPGPLVAFSLCALPWYILCLMRNGSDFPRVLFVEQTFGRFASTALQHAQPPWFYLPISLLLLYPWFPMLALTRPAWTDSRVRALTGVVMFGFVFFSAMLNKLPGYLLPLLPLTFTLAGIGLARSKRPAVPIILSVSLLGLLPVAQSILPGALAHGLRSTTIAWPMAMAWLAAAAVIGAVIAFTSRRFSFGAAAAMAGIGLLWFQIATFPRLDAAASTRPLWLASHPECVQANPRNTLYGLSYYAERQLPPCVDSTPVH
jgi:4-amino-4-deoxy-L-arabinose transferase-like glycosyltransferase